MVPEDGIVRVESVDTQMHVVCCSVCCSVAVLQYCSVAVLNFNIVPEDRIVRVESVDRLM